MSFKKEYAPIQTKLNPPHYLHDTMERRYLMQLVKKIPDLKMLSVVAPPGFGKSTFIAQLRLNLLKAYPDLHAPWLNLDAEDNDALHLTKYLCAAFQRCEKKLGQLSLHILQSGSLRSLKELYIALIEDIYRSQKSFVLFVDDFHSLEKGESLDLWQWLLENIPEALTLVVASRKKLDFPLSRLYLNQECETVSTKELQFSYIEVQDFFIKHQKKQLPDALLKKIYKKTEGWIGALQMLALTMQKSQETQALIENFSGEDRGLMEYLSEVVFEQLSTELRDFMLSISVLNRISAPLAEELSGKQNSQEKLEEINRRNLFFIELDDKNRWYRFHHLFQDFLKRQSIKYKGEAFLKRQYHLSSKWFELAGFQEEAIQYALAGENYQRAADLISDFANQVVSNQGDHRTMLHWMKQLPESYLDSHPQIRASYAFSLTFTHNYETARDELEKLKTCLTEKKSQEEATHLLANIEMNECFLDLLQDKLNSCRKRTKQWLKKWPQISGLPKALILDARAGTHLFSSHFKDSCRDFKEAEEILKKNKAYYTYFWALCGQIGIHWSHGKFSQALSLYDFFLQETTRYSHKEFGLQKIMQVGISEIYYERGHFAKARSLQKEAHFYIRSFSSTDPNIAYYLVPVRIHFLEQNFVKALDCLQEGELWARELGYLRFQQQMRLLRIELHIQKGEIAQAQHVLEKHSWDEAEDWSDEKEDTNLVVENIFARLSLSRILMAQGHYQEALVKLKSLTKLLEKIGLMRHFLSAKIQEILCEEHLGHRDLAMSQLRECLYLASEETFISVFLEHGKKLNSTLYTLLKKLELKKSHFEKTESLEHNYKRILKFRQELLKHLENYFLQGKTNQEKSLNLFDRLSSRELEVLTSLSSAKNHTDLAKSLHISLGTLKWHLHNIYQKLGVKNRNAAVIKAQELELV